MFGTILKLVVGMAGDWLSKGFERKQKKADAEAEIAITKARAEANAWEKRATAESDWDATMAEATKTSWKDEWFTVVLTVPLVLAFLGFDQTIKAGFQALTLAPDWYFWSLLAAIAASFGFRPLVERFAAGSKR